MALNLTLPLTLSSPTLDKSPSFILSPESKLALALPTLPRIGQKQRVCVLTNIHNLTTGPSVYVTLYVLVYHTSRWGHMAEGI